MTSTTGTPAQDAGYRYLSRLLARRARRLGRVAAHERVLTVFQQLCVELEPTLSLEVGAHEASHSRWLKQAVPHARCLAFEANPYVH